MQCNDLQCSTKMTVYVIPSLSKAHGYVPYQIVQMFLQSKAKMSGMARPDLLTVMSDGVSSSTSLSESVSYSSSCMGRSISNSNNCNHAIVHKCDTGYAMIMICRWWHTCILLDSFSKLTGIYCWR